MIDAIANGLSRHVNISTDTWTMSLWNKDEVQFHDDHRLLGELEKLQTEIVQTPNTSVLPEKIENRHNILSTIGMTESIKRDQGSSSTSMTHVSVGTSGTAESESHTNLQSEDTGGSYARKAFASSGTKAFTGTTAKYAMMFQDSEVSTTPITLRESGIHWAASGDSNLHARVAFSDFELSSGSLFVVQITEQQANGTL